MIGSLLLLWCAGITHGNLALVTLDRDQPLLQTMVKDTAELLCCYEVKGLSVEPIWVVSVGVTKGTNVTRWVMSTRPVHVDNQRVTREAAKPSRHGTPCHALKVRQVVVNDMGLYQCLLNHTHLYFRIHTHGTFLQVFKPMDKLLSISESAKNKIILTEGILLFLCVLVPGIPLLFKRRKRNELEKKKTKGEEENIYEGLNLDDLDSTYYQIQRSQVRGPYQDVDTMPAEEIQLEKP